MSHSPRQYLAGWSVNETPETADAARLRQAAYRVANPVLRRDAPWVLYDGMLIQVGPFETIGHWPTWRTMWHGRRVNMRPAALHRLMILTVFDA